MTADEINNATNTGLSPELNASNNVTANTTLTPETIEK